MRNYKNKKIVLNNCFNIFEQVNINDINTED